MTLPVNLPQLFAAIGDNPETFISQLETAFAGSSDEDKYQRYLATHAGEDGLLNFADYKRMLEANMGLFANLTGQLAAIRKSSLASKEKKKQGRKCTH